MLPAQLPKATSRTKVRHKYPFGLELLKFIRRQPIERDNSLMNILVADDDPGCVHLLQEVLEVIPDVEVITAFDGAEAWWWLTHPDLKFSLAVLDIKMPKVDGFALLTRIRQTPTLATLPVIMCTGIIDRRLVAKAAQLKISHYLMKPFNPETLLEKTEELLPTRSGRSVTIT